MNFFWCLLLVCAQRTFATETVVAVEETNVIDHLFVTVNGLLDNLKQVGSLTGVVSAEDVESIRGLVGTVDNVVDVINGAVTNLFGDDLTNVINGDAEGTVDNIIDQVDTLLATVNESAATGEFDLVAIEAETQQILDHIFNTVHSVLNTIEHVGEITGLFDGDDLAPVRNVIHVVDVALEHVTTAVAGIASHFTEALGNVINFLG